MKQCAKCGVELPEDSPGGQCVQCLLQLALGQSGLSAQPAATGLEALAGAAGTLAAGETFPRFDNYNIVRKLGEGGYGVVYLAEQLRPVRRFVALKVIKLGMDTRQVIARFEAERQALALMEHPNIAKVFDAGATDTGRPYFAMELVSGARITDYCDQKRFSTRQRLELFMQVCQAIQHAHQKGIIHRDIKPSNILVAEQDGVPVPKIIDFGIAKAISGQRLSDQTFFTAMEQFVGTPAYMSPEQAGMGGLDIDTRSDIYSLGVLLYELLTDQPPFDTATLHRSALDEILRIIREDEPSPPSIRLAILTKEGLTSVAGRRQTEVARLPGLVRGDLDWIVMKAMDKDRTRRYGSANGLAMDLQRHLDSEPVVARPATQLYRLGKLIRRNKVAVAASAAVAFALVAGLAFSTWSYLKEKQARLRALAAEQAQQVLREEAARLRQLSSLALQLLSQGKQVEAEAMQRDTLRLQKNRLGDQNPDVAMSMNNLAIVLQSEGKLAESEAMQRQALGLNRRVAGNEDLGVALSLANLGDVLRLQGKLTESELNQRQALALYEKLLGPRHSAVADSRNNLVEVLRDEGKQAEAEALLAKRGTGQGKARESSGRSAGSGDEGVADRLGKPGKETGFRRVQSIPGWGEVINPDGDCNFEVDGGKVTVTVPGTDKVHTLSSAYEKYNAPRILREVEGDFTAQVKVAGDFDPGTERGVEVVAHGRNPFNGAGLLLWDSEAHYLRLERNVWVIGDGSRYSYTPLFEYWRDDTQLTGSDGRPAPEFKGQPSYFKIERKGERVTAAVSEDGVEWRETNSVATEFPKKIKIGVVAINSAMRPLTVEFADFKVTGE